MKRTPTEWEKVFANDISDKGIIFKTYTEFLQLNIKTTRKTTSLKNGQTTQIFFQRGHPDGQQMYEKMLNITKHQGNAS